MFSLFLGTMRTIEEYDKGIIVMCFAVGHQPGSRIADPIMEPGVE
jgi:hypothetical protein